MPSVKPMPGSPLCVRGFAGDFTLHHGLAVDSLSASGVSTPDPILPRSRSLDGVRGLAALGVLVFHCVYFNGFWSRLYSESKMTGVLVANSANFCVCVFFVLSGFLLFREFLGRILFDEATTPTRSYFTRRFLRIYPAYWAALLGFVVLLGADQLHGSVFGLVTLTERNLNSTQPEPGIPVTWSLFIEIAFYVFLPLAAAVLSRVCRGKPVATRLRIILGSLIGFAVFSILWIFLVDRFANSDLRLMMNLPTYLVWFAPGMGLATVLRCHQEGLHISPRISRLARHPWWCWVGALALNLAIAKLNLLPSTSATAVERQVRLTALAIAAFLVVLPLVLTSRPSRIHTVVGARLLAWVGTVSYGVYLWHVIVILVILKLTDHGAFRNTFGATLELIAVVLPISLLLGWISFWGIEQPAMSLAPPRGARSMGSQQDR